MPATKKAPPKLFSGPWKGVFDTTDPFDASPDYLRDLRNGYIPDPQAGSGAYARNGFALGNFGNPMTTAPGALYGQAVHSHTGTDGVILNFMVIAGKLLRVGTPTPGTWTVTDVTPVGITINSGNVPVAIVSLLDNIVVNDHTNTPWVGTNLTATPITGTKIDYDGAGTDWEAHGAPQVWQGAVFFALHSVGANGRHEDIAWSEPGQPLVGYQQVGSSNWMTLTQHATGGLTALQATNQGLYYFRAQSIGVIYGSLSTLASSNTDDAVSVNVGTTAWRTIQQFGTSIFFCDAIGRPYRFTPGSPPVPIWHQMRSITQNVGGNEAAQLPTYASSAIEPTLNLYLVTIWRPDVTAADTSDPTTIYVFDAATGTYMGRWSINDLGSGGIGISTMGILKGADDDEPTVVILGESVVGTQSLGHVWYFRIRGFPFPDPFQWRDNATYPYVVATTDRMGESDDLVFNVDRAIVTTGNADPCSVMIQTPTTSGAAIGTPTPGVSQDGTYRLVVGCDVQGRGPSVMIRPQPTNTTSPQWNVQRVSLVAVASQAVDDV